MINENDLKKYFKKQDYESCINILTKEIKDNLIKRIQIFYPDYKYKNITDLKNNCFKYLKDLEKIFAVQLYDFSYNEVSNEIELASLLEMYEYYK